MTFALIPYRELISGRYGETGRPVRVARHGSLIAIVSALPRLVWAGRAAYEGQRPLYRIALYDGERRVAVCDDVRDFINDLSFHPHQRVLAIASGQYDGGYFHEGKLLLWHWETGELQSVLAESRTILRCAFDDAGQLAILLRLPHDDDDESPDNAVLGTILEDLSPRHPLGADTDPRLVGLRPVEPARLGFAPDRHDVERDMVQLGISPRGRIWDLAWLPDGRIAVAHEYGRVELWSPQGECLLAASADGDAVQLLQQPGRLLAHVVEDRDRSTLYAVTAAGLERWHTFDSPHLCSVDAAGRVLARSVDGRYSTTDTVLAADGSILFEGDLGHYDVFNHHIRLDGGDALYFLRGTPADQHALKRLCRIDESGAIHEGMQWDSARDHLMSSCAVLVEDGVVRCYSVHVASRTNPMFVERVGGSPVHWRVPVQALATSMVLWPAAGAVVVALLDCTLLVLDVATGTVLWRNRFELDGVPTIPYALAVFDDALAIGTVDGRIAIYARQ